MKTAIIRFSALHDKKVYLLPSDGRAVSL